MDMIRMSIAKDFSDTPGGRFIKEGDHSGELFRNSILRPCYEKALNENKKLYVDLDGCMGYPSSFLDESFGKLSRENISRDVFADFVFKSDDQPGLVEIIKNIMQKR